MKQGQTHTFTLDEQHSNSRLDKILASLLPEESRSFLQKLVKEGHVLRNGMPLSQPSQKMHAGDCIAVHLPPETSLELKPETIPLEILYEDDALIIVNKPAHLSVHPSAPEPSGTLVNALLAHCKQLSHVGGAERPGIVHRLDKGTSGVMVVAKTDEAHRHLAQQFAERTIERFYYAVCYGIPLPRSGSIITPLGRHPKDRKRMAVLESGGKQAHTDYQTLAVSTDGALSFVRFKLHTGRTHQIRVHAHHKNMPIVGDPVYGKPKELSRSSFEVQNLVKGLTHQMLHAAVLGITHPHRNTPLRFQAPPPADMCALIAALGIDQPIEF